MLEPRLPIPVFQLGEASPDCVNLATSESDKTMSNRIAILAEQVRRAPPGSPDADHAMRELVPEIHRIAKRVLVRLGGSCIDFDVLGSPSIIWQKLPAFDASRGAFADWASTVLRNHVIDELRKSPRKATIESTGLPSKHERIEDTIDWRSSFGDEDLSQIASWPLRDRIVLLLTSRLWHKVPDETWKDWCVELSIDHQPTDVPSSFDDWLDSIAGVVGSTKNATKQFWYRRRDRLKRLTFIRGLSGIEND